MCQALVAVDIITMSQSTIRFPLPPVFCQAGATQPPVIELQLYNLQILALATVSLMTPPNSWCVAHMLGLAPRAAEAAEAAVPRDHDLRALKLLLAS